MLAKLTCLTRYFRSVLLKFLQKREASGLLVAKSNYLTVYLLSWGCMYYVILFLFSILGVAVSGSFFAIHLLHIAKENQLLRRVIMAVTLNGKQIKFMYSWSKGEREPEYSV